MIIGRKKEQQRLKKAYQANKSTFIALYGRRRVGKTYLIKTLMKAQKGIYFQLTGEKKGSLVTQLGNFAQAYALAFYQDAQLALERPSSWHNAFAKLTQTIKQIPAATKVTLFFDELPWLATPKSNLLSALEYYWNQFWVDMPNITLIVCGSAASWMLKNIVRNKDGLHNRLSENIRLEPLNLAETAQYLQHTFPTLTQKQLLQIYNVMGGIPYYLSKLDNTLSITQNIDRLFFDKMGLLFNEFNELFSSLFSDAKAYEEIVKILHQHPAGLTRQQLLEKLSLSTDGGNFNQKLLALIESGFIIEFGAFDNKTITYRLIDEYANFYLKWVQPRVKAISRMTQLQTYWQTINNSPGYNTWKGYAFENLCYKHLLPISKAAHIEQIEAVGNWQYHAKTAKASGTQIDLVFDRSDDTMNICEIKSSDSVFVISKKYALDLRSKIQIFRGKTRTSKQIILLLIAPQGIKENTHSKALGVWGISLTDIINHCD